MKGMSNYTGSPWGIAGRPLIFSKDHFSQENVNLKLIASKHHSLF